jgi:4-hydroxythreonine-4-phosphate dehydrogenase
MAAFGPIAVTCGDPLGIGPEVAVVAASQTDVDLVLVGPRPLWERAAALRGVTLDSPIEEPGPVGGESWGALPELAAIGHAVQGCLSGRYSAVCTAPIHKAPLLEAGFPHAGHTGWLGALCGAAPEDAVMCFAGGRLQVALVTTHVPLREVSDRLTTDGIVHVATAAAAMMGRLGFVKTRVALCGLNPHAGEDGKLGTEDGEVIAPAVQRLRSAGIDASGPHPGDTVFARALRGEFDLVVAMYHDQGLAPVKTVDFGKSVNITAGLPIVRTSVDHGTARDIAWTGTADADPMRAAIAMAARLR